MRTALVFGGLALVLAASGGMVLQKERLLTRGDVVLLELAPADPRSLIQGDYMRLGYALTREVDAQARTWPRDGVLIVKLDAHRVATFARLDDGTPLAPDEHRLRYRVRAAGLRLGAEEFFFQEGEGDRLARAKYGELRVDDGGGAVLAGLRDAQHASLMRGRAFTPRSADP